MSDGDWGDGASSSNQRGRGGYRGRGGGRGRGGFNRNNDYDSNTEGNDWGYNGGGGGDGGEWFGDNDGERDGGSRGRGRGRGRGGGRGGGKSFDRNNDAEEGGDFGGDDQQPPASDKPRPTYIPPEINENDDYGIGVGSNFNKYENIEVRVSGDSVPKHIKSFKSSGLREVLIEKLVKCNYTTPTPIQKYAIPIIINGRDMMATAQTGSGKTVSIVN